MQPSTACYWGSSSISMQSWRRHTNTAVDRRRVLKGEDKGRLASIQRQPTVNTLRPIRADCSRHPFLVALMKNDINFSTFPQRTRPVCLIFFLYNSHKGFRRLDLHPLKWICQSNDIVYMLTAYTRTHNGLLNNRQSSFCKMRQKRTINREVTVKATTLDVTITNE